MENSLHISVTVVTDFYGLYGMVPESFVFSPTLLWKFWDSRSSKEVFLKSLVLINSTTGSFLLVIMISHCFLFWQIATVKCLLYCTKWLNTVNVRNTYIILKHKMLFRSGNIDGGSLFYSVSILWKKYCWFTDVLEVSAYTVQRWEFLPF